MFRKFLTASPINGLCLNFVKYGGREIGKILRCLYLTKNSPASQTVATARIAPKIYQGQPPTMYLEYSGFHPNQITFGGVIYS